jgi:hypothetical protein
MAENWTPESLKREIAGKELKVKDWLWITHAIAEKAWISLRMLKSDVLRATGKDKTEKEKKFNAAKNALLSLAKEISEEIVKKSSRRQRKDMVYAYTGDTFILENKTTDEASDTTHQEWKITLSNWGDVKIDNLNSIKTYFTKKVEWEQFNKDENVAEQEKVIKAIITKNKQKFGTWQWTSNDDINWWTFTPKWSTAINWANQRYILQQNGSLKLQK